jgi:A/G-specific adenine glycosylase
MSEVMLQQTTVAAVRAYFLRFTERWPTVADLAAAADADVMAEWAGLGYYARARNLLACARAVVRDHQGRFPTTLEGLRSLPGVGPYTAAAVASIAYDLPETVVDGNVERVMARLFAVETPLPTAKPELTRLAASVTPQKRAGDYAQAVMDLGATVCTPRNPACAICPLLNLCAARRLGIQADLPRKLAKPEKPTRTGTLWALRNPAGDWLLEHRPERGLLGGMLGFPTTGWDGSTTAPPVTADWTHAGEVHHTFTHFHLVLTVLTATTTANPAQGHFQQVRPTDLPTVMRKAHAAASKANPPR